MVASNYGGFSWTEEKSSTVLDIITHLVISKKLDPLADGTIEMVLSKVVEFKDFTLFHEHYETHKYNKFTSIVSI